MRSWLADLLLGGVGVECDGGVEVGARSGRGGHDEANTVMHTGVSMRSWLVDLLLGGAGAECDG
eukprot:6474057-Alexandrium_andersonii.AAC.1